MKRSFSEYNTQKDVERHETQLTEVTQRLAGLPQAFDYSQDLNAYYDACDEYWQLRSDVHVSATSLPPDIYF